MGIINRRSFSDLRGAVRLASEATVGVTDVVEKMHHTIQLGHPPVGVSRATNARGLAGLVYSSIRGTARLVSRGIDAGMAPLAELIPDAESNATRDKLVSVINGMYGDHLVQTANPLALEMTVRYAGQKISPEKPDTLPAVATGKLMLFVHGLCLNDGHWARDGHNTGEALATGLGYTPLYLRYNTGLSIADNGRRLAGVIENLQREWPVPVSELVIIGHSMGGLVARSAYHQGSLASHDWLQHLRSLVFIGTPHHGAPLERGGNWLDEVMNLSPYAAPFTRIARKRSAGIIDLRHGSITGAMHDFVPLPAGVKCYAMAAIRGKKRGRVSEQLIGDGLVPLDSALGRSKVAGRGLDIPVSHQWVGLETGHNELLSHPEVYAQLGDWLG